LKGIAETYKQYADTLESGLMTPALILLGSVLLAFYNYIILKPLLKGWVWLCQIYQPCRR